MFGEFGFGNRIGSGLQTRAGLRAGFERRGANGHNGLREIETALTHAVEDFKANYEEYLDQD
jgi:hypothetical protein